MKCLFKSIIACICGLTIVLSSAVPPAFARDGVIGGVVDGAQSFVEWSVGTINDFWKVIFGEDFNSANEEELKAAYDDYVQTLPAPSYGSGGELRWRLNVNSCTPSSYVRIDSFFVGSSFEAVYISSKPTSNSSFITFGVDKFIAPVSGSYRLGAYFSGTGGYFDLAYNYSDTSFACLFNHYDSLISRVGSSYGIENGQYFNFPNEVDFLVGDVVVPATDFILCCRSASFAFYRGYLELFCKPVASSFDTYNINTRPTSITGGNYGIVGDNGQITKVEDNSTIINETNNTYYNPATGQTVPITNWSYDYSDRSYKVILESGDTATITYGDENISITETNESGDTITNNYTIYYLVDGAGLETTPCEHTWTEISTTPATCTLPGKASYVCSNCQQTKTETIPALGHNWQVKQTVTTQYDETGQLTQEGYTIFECSRCHEQYKSTDGTAPPGGGSTTEPGEEKETIWQKIGKLFGIVGDGIIGMIEAAVGKVLDGLISLAEMLVAKLKTVVETVLSIFDELPLLFGGFLDFLAAVFPFLPPEIMTILTFGIVAVVFIAIIKVVRR